MYCEVTPNEPNPATAASIPDSKNSIEEWLSEDFSSWDFFLYLRISLILCMQLSEADQTKMMNLSFGISTLKQLLLIRLKKNFNI
jgi:hypothetical protein